MPKEFSKRIYTASKAWRDFSFFFANLPRIISAAWKNPEIPTSFRERIMVVVSSLNACRYCQWFHAKKAVDSGIDDQEVKNMLKLQFQTDAPDFEVPALLYAQHFVESDCNPDPAMTKRLEDFYGQKTAADIILIIRLIYTGNISGNTFDAFLSRFKGMKAKNSNFLFELVFFVLVSPILLPVLVLARPREN
ncbi:MAG: carboxymuconolactone decarboxylase family protein [Deltaproteobacteria bacterium]|nr:carboxymuconolactone decarboxylase family protein [Deltaproteobacteria bacterium]